MSPRGEAHSHDDSIGRLLILVKTKGVSLEFFNFIIIQHSEENNSQQKHDEINNFFDYNLDRAGFSDKTILFMPFCRIKRS